MVLYVFRKGSHLSPENHKEKTPALRAGVCKMAEAFAGLFAARSDRYRVRRQGSSSSTLVIL
jgi:hypothetical protein